MFDFDAGKIIIIGIVALIVIGPKELPRVLRQLGQAVAKMRRMGAEFQNQFMDAMREAEVADIKSDLAKLKDSSNLDLPHFNPVQDIRREMTAALGTPVAASAASKDLGDPEAGTLGHGGSLIEPPKELEPPQTPPKDVAPLPPHLNGPIDETGVKIAPPETQASARTLS